MLMLSSHHRKILKSLCLQFLLAEENSMVVSCGKKFIFFFFFPRNQICLGVFMSSKLLRKKTTKM